MSLYNDNAKYEKDQTPEELAKQLIQQIPIQQGDVLYEPFRGQGSFFNNFPSHCEKHWTEIKEDRDYRTFTEDVDWVITNPPFRMESGKNCFFPLLKEFAPRVRKGVCFLGDMMCLNSLTPLRQKELNGLGLYLSRITMCNVKRWRGRYFFLQFTKQKNDTIGYLEGTF